MGYDIFISYRRETSKYQARILSAELGKRGYHVFLDLDGLHDGEWEERIKEVIKEAPIFIIILSKGSLDRCVNENDNVRKEILYACETNRHIIPVVIDDNFKDKTDIPLNIPETILKTINLQRSDIDLGTLHQESINKMVNERIVPHVGNKKDENSEKDSSSSKGAEIHIDVDVNCDVYRFKKMLSALVAGQDNIIFLIPGKHRLTFVSKEHPDISETQECVVPTENYSDIINVKLADKIKTKLKKEREKREAAEREQRKKEEAERKRIAEEKEAQRRREEALKIKKAQEEREKLEAEQRRYAAEKAEREIIAAEEKAARLRREQEEKRIAEERQRRIQEEERRRKEAELRRVSSSSQEKLYRKHKNTAFGVSFSYSFIEGFDTFMFNLPLLIYVLSLIYRLIAVKHGCVEDEEISPFSLGAYLVSAFLLPIYYWLREELVRSRVVKFFANVTIAIVLFLLCIFVLPHFHLFGTLLFSRDGSILILVGMAAVTHLLFNCIIDPEDNVSWGWGCIIPLIIIYQWVFLVNGDIFNGNFFYTCFSIIFLEFIGGAIIGIITIPVGLIAKKVVKFEGDFIFVFIFQMLVFCNMIFAAKNIVSTPANEILYGHNKYSEKEIVDMVSNDYTLLNIIDSLSYAIGRVQGQQVLNEQTTAEEKEIYCEGIIYGFLRSYTRVEQKNTQRSRTYKNSDSVFTIYEKGEFYGIELSCNWDDTAKVYTFPEINDSIPHGYERWQRGRVKYIAGLIQGLRQDDEIMTNEQAKKYLSINKQKK